jgi:hypothetical protein
MELGDTFCDGVTCSNSEVLVVKNYEINDVSALVCRIIVVEIRRQRPNDGLLSRWNKQMLQILNVAVDLHCSIDSVARNLDRQHVSRRLDETVSATHSLVKW